MATDGEVVIGSITVEEYQLEHTVANAAWVDIRMATRMLVIGVAQTTSDRQIVHPRREPDKSSVNSWPY